MSHVVNVRCVTVTTRVPSGEPCALVLPAERGGVAKVCIITRCLSYQRRYVNAAQGEPEVDIWQIETEDGRLGELHRLRASSDSDTARAEEWRLYRWLD